MPLSEKKQRWLVAHPELGRHQSMTRRHDHHDYRSPCIYMITLVVNNRRPLLGKVVDPDDKHPQPWFSPSPLGERIAQCWREIPQFYPQIRLLSLQLMPDHLHGIIHVTEQLPRHLGHVINGFKVACNRVAKEMSLSPLWEEGYNDSILQGKGQLNAMFKYLEDNPRRLWTKRNNPDFFRTQQEVKIGDQNVTVMGNRFLLDSPNKVAVKCSRKMTDSDIETATSRFMMMAQRGAVLVSPRISPGEKAVMDMIQAAGFPFIQLLENGFSPMWKPGGEMFDACASGQVLLVAPWPYHTDRHTITRDQCLFLNDLATLICSQ
jgi:REP element-mobilizing transposase RayT